MTWAGRIVIVNHVLLSTMWHVTSSNLLWSGGEGAFARAKVAWSTLTLPKSKGGLGLIDPENQSKAMLAKLLVRGLLPGNETWKMILQSRIEGLLPKNGGPWQPCIRWAFLKGGRVSTLKALEDRFLNSILIAWSAVKEGM